jgi:hypothetical protein
MANNIIRPSMILRYVCNRIKEEVALGYDIEQRFTVWSDHYAFTSEEQLELTEYILKAYNA